MVAGDLEAEEVEVVEEAEEGVTEMVEGTLNSTENTSALMTVKEDQINHRRRSRRGAVEALSPLSTLEKVVKRDHFGSVYGRLRHCGNWHLHTSLQGNYAFKTFQVEGLYLLVGCLYSFCEVTCEAPAGPSYGTHLRCTFLTRFLSPTIVARFKSTMSTTIEGGFFISSHITF